MIRTICQMQLSVGQRKTIDNKTIQRHYLTSNSQTYKHSTVKGIENKEVYNMTQTHRLVFHDQSKGYLDRLIEANFNKQERTRISNSNMYTGIGHSASSIVQTNINPHCQYMCYCSMMTVEHRL